MASELPTLSRTDKNLWSAIVSEALAYLKYNAYAHRALEEGHPEVAQVFQEVAGAETIHGLNHLRVSGEIGPTEGESAHRYHRRVQRVHHHVPQDDPGGHCRKSYRRRRVLFPGPGTGAAPPDGVHPGAGSAGKENLPCAGGCGPCLPARGAFPRPAARPQRRSHQLLPLRRQI